MAATSPEAGYVPGSLDTLFGNVNLNPLSANYLSDSGQSPNSTALINRAIKYMIFDAAPAQYNAMKLLYEKPFEEVGSDEFEYFENTFGRSALTAASSPGAVSASGMTNVTQTLTVTDGTKCTLDQTIIYSDGTKATITGISGNVLTLKSYSGGSLPAVASGDVIAIQSANSADGIDYFGNYERIVPVKRYNYVQLFARAERWAEIEMQKYINQGTTNFLDEQKQHKLKQLRIDLFSSFINGTRGEFVLSGGKVGKATGGVYPTMVAAGSAHATTPLAGLGSTLESLGYSTNYKAEGDVRMILATSQNLNEISKIYKQSLVRYAPNDTIANLQLNKIEMPGMNFVLVPVELFRETSVFPAAWQSKLLVLDYETISPVKIKGVEAMRMGETLSRKNNPGTREAFTDFWVWAQLGVRMNNPLSSFYIDLT